MGVAIEVTGLVKRYGDKLAVDGVSFSVAEGEAFGYVGPNGAGKTTTIRSIRRRRACTDGRSASPSASSSPGSS